MSVDLFLHHKRIKSVFQLLGIKENDMTYSLGWALAQSPGLVSSILKTLFPRDRELKIERVELQYHAQDGGFTDIELWGPEVHVIVEAKRGWTLPTNKQLQRYAARLPRERGIRTALVTMSECSGEYADLHLMKTIDRVSVKHLPWSVVQRLCRVQDGTHAEKRLLAEFRTYLEQVIKMQNQKSNMVFVVSLGPGTPVWAKLSWIDIVEKRRRYFHKVGDGWPKEPPNYVAFRYRGQLRSIHHVDGWKIITDIHQEIPELKPGAWKPHFLYTLGPPIRPTDTVKNGKIYPNGRVWAALDLLLTSKTVSQARDLTKKRLAIES